MLPRIVLKNQRVRGRALFLSSGKSAGAKHAPGHQPDYAGSFATTLISNWKPYSQVTPTAVTVGCGAAPQ